MLAQQAVAMSSQSGVCWNERQNEVDSVVHCSLNFAFNVAFLELYLYAKQQTLHAISFIGFNDDARAKPAQQTLLFQNPGQAVDMIIDLHQVVDTDGPSNHPSIFRT